MIKSILTLASAATLAIGGSLVRPNSQKGEILIVNCQTEADGAWVASVADYFRTETRYRITVKNAGVFSMTAAIPEGEAHLYVIDDGAQPMSLVAPESRWTMVNIASLKTADSALFESRVRKHVSRGFAQLCGGSVSRYRKNVLWGVEAPEALDKIESYKLPLDAIQMMKSHLAQFGIHPGTPVTYARACQEGWAPAPSNVLQRALWEKAEKARQSKSKE